MSLVTYNNQRLIPAPLITISKAYNKSGDGEIIGSKFEISIDGTIIAFKGSPTSSGTFYTGTGYPSDESVDSDSRLDAIMRKQEAIRDLFSTEGQLLLIKSADGGVALSGYPRVNGITFPQGQWYNTSIYSINLELDLLGPNIEDSFSQQISTASETWGIETDENRPEGIGLPRTYRYVHNLNAIGKRYYDADGLSKPAWKQARDWVQNRLGFDTNFVTSSGAINLPGYYSGYNHVRNEQIGETEGSYSITENWILASGNTLEDFTVSTNHTIDNGIKSVNINGTVTGLEERDADLNLTTTKYENASARFVAVSGMAYTRAQTYSGLTNLNINPASYTIGRNDVVGVINYNIGYNTRPYNIVSGALSEVISVTDNVGGGEAFAEIFVLGRTIGPVLQPLDTQASSQRSLNIELVLVPPTVNGSISAIRNAFHNSNPRINVSTSGAIQNLITAISPTYSYGKVFSAPPQERWDFKNGRYSYTQSWTYQPSG